MKKFARFSTSEAVCRRVKQAFYFFISFLSSSLTAQTDSLQPAIQLPETTILERRFSRTGYTSWQADSLPAISVLSLASRLSFENSLQLRQNAPGTLATISARGAGPNRTPVLWQGLNLQSPMNGVVDAALIPLWPGDQLEVLQGGNSAAQSSGVMGGSVLLESPLPKTAQPFAGHLGMEGGSFGWKNVQANADFASGRFSSRLRAQWQTAKNDFPFRKKGLNGEPYLTKQQHNFQEKTDVQQFNRLEINKKNVLNTAAWFQQAYRQIPPATTESASDTWQKDRSGRAVATWEYHPQQGSKLQTRLAWQEEFIAFHFAGATEKSRAQTTSIATEWSRQQGRHSEWRLGGSGQHVRARSDGYKNSNRWYRQIRLAAFAQGERSFGQAGKVSVLLRQEWAEAQASPFTWTLGWEIPTGGAGRIRGHLSRNFNLPTFNDRFWETLDSSALSPEKGYSADLGWAFKKRRFSLEITAFQLILDDWILWQPGADGIFRPGNLRKVGSRGIEAAGHLALKCGGINWKIRGRVQWSETKNTAVYGGAGAVLDKQLPYTPNVLAGGGLEATRGGFAGVYLHQVTGSRFVTSDNKNALPAFQTGTMMLRYAFKRRFWRWSRSLAVDGAIENIWNTRYESLANRPMPGRNWRAGFVIGW